MSDADKAIQWMNDNGVCLVPWQEEFIRTNFDPKAPPNHVVAYGNRSGKGSWNTLAEALRVWYEAHGYKITEVSGIGFRADLVQRQSLAGLDTSVDVWDEFSFMDDSDSSGDGR